MRTKWTLFSVGAALFAVLSIANSASAFTVGSFPSIGADTSGPEVTITINANGSVTVTQNAGVGPYDGNDDTYVGVINNSSSPLLSLKLSQPGSPIFGFDGDGIATYITVPNNVDPNGYGGPYVTYSGINAAQDTGTVNFGNGGISGSGGKGYFSLEEDITNAAASLGVTVTSPEPASMFLAGMGILGMAGYGWRRRKTQA